MVRLWVWGIQSNPVVVVESTVLFGLSCIHHCQVAMEVRSLNVINRAEFVPSLSQYVQYSVHF
jgi:hypothetical protein